MSDIYLKRKQKFSEWSQTIPKLLFIFMAITGAMIVWAMKSFALHPLIVIAVPVSMILIYCGLAWKVKYFYIREDQIGDNAYYLGFLYTLSSLAYALWLFHVNNGSDPANIIGSFGVALWSTIFGIALRVFFSQLRQDPDDIEREARVKVAQTASLLASDLYQSSVTFNTYTRGLQQSVDEVFVKANEVSAKTISAVEELNTKINQMESPDSIINRKIDSVFADLEQATQKLNGLAAQQAQSVDVLASSSGQLVDNLGSLNSQIAGIHTSSISVSKLEENIQSIGPLLQSLQDNLTKLSNGLSDLHTKNTATVDGIAKHADELEGQLARARKYTEQTHESLASMTRTLAEKLQ